MYLQTRVSLVPVLSPFTWLNISNKINPSAQVELVTMFGPLTTFWPDRQTDRQPKRQTMASAMQVKFNFNCRRCMERVIIGKGQAQGAGAGKLLADKER